jgi:DNA-binding PadR family transcriptional regulator
VPGRDLLSSEYAALALLRLQPMYGYEMVPYLASAHLSEACPIESGMLYTCLRNVEQRGLVSWTEVRIGKRPPRKLYDLAESGRTLVDTWLQTPVQRMEEVQRDLLVKLYVLHLIAPDTERELVANQIDVCQEQVDRIPTAGGGDSFLRLVAESKRATGDATVGWLREYARELTQGQLSV